MDNKPVSNLNIVTNEGIAIEVNVPSLDADYEDAVSEVRDIESPIGIDDLPKNVREIFKGENGEDLPSNFVVEGYDSESDLIHGHIIKESDDLELSEEPMTAKVGVEVDPVTEKKYPEKWYENTVEDMGDMINVAKILSKRTGQSYNDIVAGLKAAFKKGGMAEVQNYIKNPVKQESMITINPNKILAQKPLSYVPDFVKTKVLRINRPTQIERKEDNGQYISGVR